MANYGLDFLDFDGSGGLNFGDIGAGLSQGASAAYDFGTGLLGGESGGVGTQAFTAGSNLLPSGSGLMDYLTKNKDVLSMLGTGVAGLGGLYTDYNTMKNAEKLYDAQIADYQRSIDKEEEAQASMQAGFASSGLSDYYTA